MVLPGETEVPEYDEVRLLKSGRIKMTLEGDRRFTLRRPTFGELRKLMERYDEINDEIFEPIEPGQRRRTTKPGKDHLSPGGRWLSEVMVLLGPTEPQPIYDNAETPSWAVQADIMFNTFFRHWTEVPLVSDVEVPEPKGVVIPMPTPTEPQLIRQVIPGSTGP